MRKAFSRSAAAAPTPPPAPRRYRRRLGDSGEEAGKQPIWILIFTDLMGLMLTFFVLMFSMRAPEPRTFESLTAGFQQKIAEILDSRQDSGPVDSIDLGRADFSRALDLDYLEAIVRQRVEERQDALRGAVLIPQSASLIVSLPQDSVFTAGKDKEEVSENGKAALEAMAGILARLRNRVEIVGYADSHPSPDRPGPNPPSRELSLARAVAAAQALRAAGYDRPVVTRGLGAALSRKIPAALPEAMRQDLSRRVDIVLMSDDGTRRKFLDIGTD